MRPCGGGDRKGLGVMSLVVTQGPSRCGSVSDPARLAGFGREHLSVVAESGEASVEL